MLTVISEEFLASNRKRKHARIHRYDLGYRSWGKFKKGSGWLRVALTHKIYISFSHLDRLEKRYYLYMGKLDQQYIRIYFIWFQIHYYFSCSFLTLLLHVQKTERNTIQISFKNKQSWHQTKSLPHWEETTNKCKDTLLNGRKYLHTIFWTRESNNS